MIGEQRSPVQANGILLLQLWGLSLVLVFSVYFEGLPFKIGSKTLCALDRKTMQ